MKKKILALFLTVFLFIGMLGACQSKTNDVIISNIDDYKIVYSRNATALEQSSANFLADYIFQTTGNQLQVIEDSAKETEYEILIGNTNRNASKTAKNLTYNENDILIKADGKKVVLFGEELMLAGATGQFANHYVNPGKEIKLSNKNQTVSYEFEAAKNIILMIGDGMGFNHVELVKSKGLDVFKAELLPNKGSIITDSLDGTTDSAASSTALSSGYKTKNDYVGIDSNKQSKINIREVAYEAGYKTAVVTTDTITGATPSGFLAHTDNRKNTDDILAQIDKLIENGEINYIAGTDGEPMFDDVKAALKETSSDSDGFFIMIEEGHIDKRSHYMDIENTASVMKRFDESIGYTIAFIMAHPDTALIITADHETGNLQKKQDGTFAFSQIAHTSENVPVYAIGQGTEMFNGTTLENTEIAKFMGRIFGVANLGS